MKPKSNFSPKVCLSALLPTKLTGLNLKQTFSFRTSFETKRIFYGNESSQYYNPEDYNPFKRKSTWTPDKNREPALDLFIHLITKDILHTKPLKIADNLIKQEREALKNLTERNDIVIKPTDKGRATIIMDTEKYRAECYRQLNDPKFYKRLPKDITHQVEDRICICLKRLLIDDEIRPVIINDNRTSVHSPTFTLCICSFCPCLSFNPISQSYSWYCF